MKYLNSIWDILFEAVEPYEWEFISDNEKNVRYRFTDTMGNNYLVEFKNIPRLKSSANDLGTEYEISYFVLDKESDYYNVSKLVNVNPYKTLHTIFGGVLYDFIKRKSWVKKPTMTGLAKDTERTYVSQRTRMYVRYLERNPIPGFKMENYGNKINLVKI